MIVETRLPGGGADAGANFVKRRGRILHTIVWVKLHDAVATVVRDKRTGGGGIQKEHGALTSLHRGDVGHIECQVPHGSAFDPYRKCALRWTLQCFVNPQ